MNTWRIGGMSTPVDLQNRAPNGSIDAARSAVTNVFQGALGITGGKRRMMMAIQDTPSGVPTAWLSNPIVRAMKTSYARAKSSRNRGLLLLYRVYQKRAKETTNAAPPTVSNTWRHSPCLASCLAPRVPGRE